MRRRLVVTTTVVATVTATMFGVPIGLFGQRYFGRGWQEFFAILGFGLAAVAVAVVFGFWQARRLSAQLVELAAAAERLGSGDPRPHLRRYGVPEFDRVAEMLDASAGRIAETLAAERQLSQDASHQLRSPLTALSMRLEEILAADDSAVVREEAAIALGQVERLSQVVERLLTQSRGSHASRATLVDVDTVVRQQVEEWRPAFQRARRRVEVTGLAGLSVAATPGTLGHILATLLENALHHGGGTVSVRRRTTGVRPGGSVVIEVSDGGPGVPEELGQRIFERAVSGRSGTGLGLALARDLAEAGGGRLELVSRQPAVFAVFLPRGNPPMADDSSGAPPPAGDQRPEDAPAGSRASSNGSSGTSRKTKRR